MRHFFLNDFFHYILSPTISLHGLYYKPFFALLTFFGIWLIIFFFFLFCFRRILAKLFPHLFNRLEPMLDKNTEKKTLILFLVSWFIAEFPLWVILPEHATRYATSILIPFSFLIVMMILYVFSFVKQRYQRILTIFVIFFVLLAIMTNISYVVAFRAGWGSSFIAIDKAQDFIAKDKEGKTIALYYGQSVAEEYYAINKSSKNHTLIPDLHFQQLQDESAFEQKTLLRSIETYHAEGYITIYIIKRVTTGDTALPKYNFEFYPFLKEVTIVEGRNTYDFFDVILRFLEHYGYKPNKIYIYKITLYTL